MSTWSRLNIVLHRSPSVVSSPTAGKIRLLNCQFNELSVIGKILVLDSRAEGLALIGHQCAGQRDGKNPVEVPFDFFGQLSGFHEPSDDLAIESAVLHRQRRQASVNAPDRQRKKVAET